MKKIIILFCFIAGMQTVIAQNNYADSLKIVLVSATKPIERFDILNKILDNNDGINGNFQDTAIGLQMHRIAQQLKNDSLLAISTNVIGNYFRSRSDYPTALEYFFKAIPLAEKVKDKRRLSSLYFDIAECYFNLQNLEECFKYAKTGEQHLPDRDSPMYDFMAEQFYRTTGNYYLQKNQLDSALVQIHKLEESNRRLKKPNYIMYSYIQNAAVSEKQGDNEMAELFYKKANTLADSLPTPLIRLVFNQSYIPYLISTGQFEKARQYALQLLNTGNEVNSNIFKLRAAGFLGEAYNKLKKPDSAYFYLNMQSEFKDSVFNQNNFNKIQSLAFNDQVRKIDEEAKLAAAAAQRRQNLQYALIALGIIILISLYLLLSRSFITNTKLIEFFGVIALLIVFEFLNLFLHPFLERATNHSPLLMLLALVCIAAVLVPLHHKVEKWATHKLVEKNKAVRLAAAKKTVE
ncbi:MAG TPA: hypothetical protein PLZ18_10870, partial [Ferruginibacter sp.]|nr:hypothetical protein [Ferruginibacter sp.]